MLTVAPTRSHSACAVASCSSEASCPPVVRRNSITQRPAPESIRDAARPRSEWHEPHRTLRGNGANVDACGRCWRAADQEHRDPVPCEDALSTRRRCHPVPGQYTCGRDCWWSRGDREGRYAEVRPSGDPSGPPRRYCQRVECLVGGVLKLLENPPQTLRGDLFGGRETSAEGKLLRRLLRSQELWT